MKLILDLQQILLFFTIHILSYIFFKKKISFLGVSVVS